MKGRATKAQVRVHRPVISEQDLDNPYQIRIGQGFYYAYSLDSMKINIYFLKAHAEHNAKHKYNIKYSLQSNGTSSAAPLQAKELSIQIFTLCFFIVQLAHILVFGE